MRTFILFSLIVWLSISQSYAFRTGKCENTPMCECKWFNGRRTADCSHAGLTQIPTSLNPAIQSLILNGNPITELGEDVFKSAGLLNLQNLQLSRCGIQRIHEAAFRDLKIMTLIDLSHNNITKLHEKIFDGNSNLKTLTLSHNPLKELTPSQFSPLNNIKTIDLAYCHIEFIDRTSFKNLGASVETILLNDNRLSYLADDVFSPLLNLKSLSLFGNPWLCDCRLKNFRDWVMSKNVFDGRTICYEPSRLYKKSWSEIKPIDFACKPKINIPEDTIYGTAGHDATLSCHVVGSPVPKLRWVFNGHVINNNTHPAPFADQVYVLRTERITRDGVQKWYNLTITNPSEHDLGKYKCVAENEGGIMESEVTLTFDDPATLISLITEEQWHILIGTLVVTLILLIFLVIACYWCMCRANKKYAKSSSRKRMSERNGSFDSQKLLSNTTNGSIHNGSIVAVSSSSANIVPKPPRMGEYTSVPQTDLYKYEMEMQNMSTRTPSVVSNAKNSTGSSSASTGSDNIVRAASTLSRGSHLAVEQYPDLLDHRHIYGVIRHSPSINSDHILSPSNLMISPQQQIQYAHLMTPFQRSGTLPLPHHQPQQQTQPQHHQTLRPFPSSHSYHITPLPIIHHHHQLPQTQHHIARPGYVTLPRRPRTGWSLPRDTPSPTTSTLSRNTERESHYDGCGARTSADGSSRHSLNRSMASPGNASTLSKGGQNRANMLPPYYAPIQELQECPPTPRNQQQAKSTPNILEMNHCEGPINNMPSSSSEVTLMEENISAYCEPFGKAELPTKEVVNGSTGGSQNQSTNSNRSSIASKDSSSKENHEGVVHKTQNGHDQSNLSNKTILRDHSLITNGENGGGPKSSTPMRNGVSSADNTSLLNNGNDSVLSAITNGNNVKPIPPKTLPKPKIKPVPPPKPKKSFVKNTTLETPLISFQDEGADGSEV